MKRIVNGKMYNTDTANQIASWSNSYRPSDFGYCEEALYQKKTGEYFLYGSGGAMSKYRTYSGENFWGGGSAITPLSAAAARKWCEEHISADEYVAIWGEVEE